MVGAYFSPIHQRRRQTMKRSRFSEEQIIGNLKEHQAGLGAKNLCRKHGVTMRRFTNGGQSMAG